MLMACPGWSALLLVSVILMLMMIAGCGGGQSDRVPTEISPPQHTPSADDGLAVSLAFPRHDAPLGTDSGEQYLAGLLILEEGCLRLEVPSRDAANPRPSFLLIWPDSFTFEQEEGAIRVVDGLGRPAARVGDHIRLSRAEVTYQQVTDPGFVAERYEHCAEPTFWVGDEVTVFDPRNEATQLRLSDPDVLLLRQKTVISVDRAFLTAAGVGELVLDGGCLQLKSEYSTHPIIWPAGFTPHVEGGVVEVRNGSGRTIARVGDDIAGGGGYHQRGLGECSGEAFRIYDIKVLPDVEVYFPKQDGTLAEGRIYRRYTGDLVVNRKCLGADNVVRISDGSEILGPVLLSWPSDFHLRVEDEAAEILDSTGQVVARVGDKVEFGAFSLSYEHAIEHGGLEEITPACSGSYWAVGEDMSVVETRR